MTTSTSHGDGTRHVGDPGARPAASPATRRPPPTPRRAPGSPRCSPPSAGPRSSPAPRRRLAPSPRTPRPRPTPATETAGDCDPSTLLEAAAAAAALVPPLPAPVVVPVAGATAAETPATPTAATPAITAPAAVDANAIADAAADTRRRPGGTRRPRGGGRGPADPVGGHRVRHRPATRRTGGDAQDDGQGAMPITVATTVDDGVTTLPLPAAADSTPAPPHRRLPPRRHPLPPRPRPRPTATAKRGDDDRKTDAAAAVDATASTDRHDGRQRHDGVGHRRQRRSRRGDGQLDAGRAVRPRALRAPRGRPGGTPARVPRGRRGAGAHAPDPARARRGGGAARAEGRARNRAPHRRQPRRLAAPHGRPGGPADGPGRPRPAPRLGAGPGCGRWRRPDARPRPGPRPPAHTRPGSGAPPRRSPSAASTPCGPSRPRSPPASQRARRVRARLDPTQRPTNKRGGDRMPEIKAVVPGAGSGDTISRTDTGGSMGNDTFLKLLVAQMKYQDPLQPTDSAQMMSQLAQFSSGRGPQQPQPADHRARPQPGLRLGGLHDRQDRQLQGRGRRHQDRRRQRRPARREGLRCWSSATSTSTPARSPRSAEWIPA